ncbi:wax ester/triacylglycerol synthase family O-acyltransferase [Nocardia otitidiscaviarum]|uniref:WS/DGAT/MGAT family O-acyltransferase n=1 Tax=Nocardia otitidiscaviarum TaxID=1823 RepID=UPI0004A74967|nr:wax ester/triacylglycerol synthase family O-acyltransferase [Nocardia otitidiscaviarum]MBF6133960.1 wax ester/triacylglycerol synthase family O-acyltransferase [Nocardia otitidiscaviarum]MBF6235938.1 wax ester/triacylglycerol synthase family O-acyltransferase [Nocardia otitidiscaviarum]MBF6484379.1 wax ester/triacylglycerol synthase family O-acyltransferase [Nocardia otitidiscaviarum]
MDLLNPIDAIFLGIESREHPMHVGGLQLFEPPADAGPTFTRDVFRRMTSATDVRTRFRRHPSRGLFGGFSSVSWHQADEVDLSYHLRRSALPAPGGMSELLDLTARLHGQLLDRHRPLWEARLIEGLDDGRFAVYIKIHHALIDGVSAMRLLQRTLTDDPLDTELRVPWTMGAPARPHTEPVSPWQQLRKALPRTVSSARAAVGPLRGVLDGRLELPMTAPPTMFNVPIGGARRIAVRSWPMERINAVRAATGATVNDVVLAMSSAALREYLMDHDALPDQPLIAMVPVNIRTEAETDGNIVAACLCNLGTNIADPVARLETISTSMRDAKQIFTQLPQLEAIALSALLMAPLGVSLLPGFDALPRMPFNLVISNVPGPRTPVYFQGARLDANYPLSIPFESQAMNITLNTNGDNLDFGIVGCRRIPHLDRLPEHLESGLAELEKAVA